MESQANPVPGNKLMPILVVLLVVAAFFIGSLYTRVNLLEKNSVAETPGQVAGTQGNNAAPAQPTPGPVAVDVTNAPMLGSKDAKIALVEFTDYECPFCGRLFTDSFPQIKKDYIDTGKVKYYVRDFPLVSIHPNAQKSAEAASCANEQGKFWPYHDKLFTNQQALKIEDLKKYAADLGLNTTQFNNCLEGAKYADKISNDTKEGSAYGVRGTPATFVGVANGNTVNGIEISGAVPFDVFKTAIEDALKKV